MRVIHKYQLGEIQAQNIWMPAKAQLLHVDLQHGQLCLWALVDQNQPNVSRLIRLYGTGHMLSNEQTVEQYIGTVLMHSGHLVVHVFDAGEL